MDIGSRFQNKTVLVTGGAGAIGSRLVRALTRFSDKVFVLDDLSSGFLANLPEDPRLEFLEGSILDSTLLRQALSNRPNIVFHLAASFANARSIEDPEKDLLINGLGSLRLLIASAEAALDRFVYVSTSSSFSTLGGQGPIEEVKQVPLDLHTPYQISKLLGEFYGNYARRNHGLPMCCARIFNSYGPGEVPGKFRNVIPNFFYWGIRGQSLPVNRDGMAARDFTYVEDVVEGLMRIAVCDSALGETFNLGSGNTVRIHDLARKINVLTGHAPDHMHLVDRPFWDVSCRRASIEHAQRTLGYRPRMDIEHGLKETMDWFRRNWSTIEANTDLSFQGVGAVSL
jgi:nucleoside-diphosphate-sugar epimerase